MSSQGRRGGRPSKLTPEIQEKICKHLKVGNYRGPSARSAGITHATFIEWMKRGKREPESEYGQFLEAVLKAEVDAETTLVERIFIGGMADPKWAMDLLKRKYPQRWGQDRLDVKELRDLIAKLEKRLDEREGS